MSKLASFRIRVDFDAEKYLWNSTLRLAERHQLTIYDASYLHLALRSRSPLATLDAALIRAAKDEGVDLA